MGEGEAEEKKEEEVKAEEESEKEEEPKQEESEHSEDEPEPEEEECPKVKLNDEEAAMKWFPKEFPDLTPYLLSTTFTKFGVPEKEEGFDEVKCAWSKEQKTKELMKEWILQRKLTTRIEDIKPSEWFNNKWKVWQTVLQSWIAAQTEYKGRQIRKQQDKAMKTQLKMQAAMKAKVERENKAREAAEKKAKKAAEKEAKKKAKEEAKEAKRAAKEAAKKAKEEAEQKAKEEAEKKAAEEAEKKAQEGGDS